MVGVDVGDCELSNSGTLAASNSLIPVRQPRWSQVRPQHLLLHSEATLCLPLIRPPVKVLGCPGERAPLREGVPEEKKDCTLFTQQLEVDSCSRSAHARTSPLTLAVSTIQRTVSGQLVAECAATQALECGPGRHNHCPKRRVSKVETVLTTDSSELDALMCFSA